jgi:hypothetical protein
VDIYKKAALGMITGVIILALIFILIIFNHQEMRPSGSGDSRFPFFILLPGWFTIFVPILVRKRREEQRLEEDF